MYMFPGIGKGNPDGLSKPTHPGRARRLAQPAAHSTRLARTPLVWPSRANRWKKLRKINK